MANKFSDLPTLFDSCADQIRYAYGLSGNIVANNFPTYIQNKSAVTNSVSYQDLSSFFNACADSIRNTTTVAWDIAADDFPWAISAPKDLTFLNSKPTISWTYNEVQIPGLAYNANDGYYYTASNSKTSTGYTCRANFYKLNSSLVQSNISTNYGWDNTNNMGKASCVGVVANWIIVGSNGQTSTTNNKYIIGRDCSFSTGKGYNNTAAYYSINTACKDINGRIVFWGNYNNDTLSGSCVYTDIETSSAPLSSLKGWGLGTISNHSPIISSTNINNYPIALTKNCRILTPSGGDITSSSTEYTDLVSSGYEGKKLLGSNGQIICVAQNASNSNYTTFYGDFTTSDELANHTYSSRAESRVIVGVVPYTGASGLTYNLVFYEDGTITARPPRIQDSDVFITSLNLYTTYKIKEVYSMNNKIIIVGWHGTNYANSFIAYYNI